MSVEKVGPAAGALPGDDGTDLPTPVPNERRPASLATSQRGWFADAGAVARRYSTLSKIPLAFLRWDQAGTDAVVWSPVFDLTGAWLPIVEGIRG